ncbi:MAG: FAD/NAD(P)-binding protein [Candidatus Thermoplasmatota archaeon]|nr:FAD/NAD(P)-binding protein [Candidatus Thermoplasmatota archaeon]
MANDYCPKPATVTNIKRETHNTSTLKFEFTKTKLQKDFIWKPGQFIMLGFLGIGEVAISISNVEKNNTINTTIRNVGTVTDKILKLQIGDIIYIRGPFGNSWPIEKITDKDILIVGGGMGIVPLRGVINYVKNNRNNFKFLEIIYGARTPYDMVFTDEFSDWKKIKNSTFHLTADEIPGMVSFECRLGLVTSCFPMMKTHHRNAIALVCGPEIMIRYVAKCLETIGFKDNQIYLSLERRMKCGIGKCGHCQIGMKFVCKDGPVFNYADIKPFIRPL